MNIVNMTPDEGAILDKIKEMLKDATINDYYKFDAAYNLFSDNIPSHPAGSCIKDDTIIDENMSVKWNREQVAKKQEEYMRELKRLHGVNNYIKKIINDFIIADIADSLTFIAEDKRLDKATIIFNKAWSDGQRAGIYEVLVYAVKYIDFAEELFK